MRTPPQPRIVHGSLNYATKSSLSVTLTLSPHPRVGSIRLRHENQGALTVWHLLVNQLFNGGNGGSTSNAKWAATSTKPLTKEGLNWA